MINSSEIILEFSNVSFAYKNGFNVLEDVSLVIDKGDFVCVVGPNGGGKTTLLKLMLGLIKPTKGEIKIFGLDPSEKQSNIGYVPQFSKFDANFPLSVRNVVLTGCLDENFFWGGFSKQQKKRADEIIEEVGLSGFENQLFSSLSGGQKQRILIARALMSEPKLLLLDEPTANVDIRGTEQFYAMFEKLNEKLTIVMVSHDIGFASRRVKSVVCVRKTLQVHPVAALTGAALQSLYGSDVNIIRHDHRCSETGHTCSHS